MRSTSNNQCPTCFGNGSYKITKLPDKEVQVKCKACGGTGTQPDALPGHVCTPDCPHFEPKEAKPVVVKTCTNLDCPERKGGRCTSGEATALSPRYCLLDNCFELHRDNKHSDGLSDRCPLGHLDCSGTTWGHLSDHQDSICKNCQGIGWICCPMRPSYRECPECNATGLNPKRGASVSGSGADGSAKNSYVQPEQQPLNTDSFKGHTPGARMVLPESTDIDEKPEDILAAYTINIKNEDEDSVELAMPHAIARIEQLISHRSKEAQLVLIHELWDAWCADNDKTFEELLQNKMGELSE